jgi:hypothetical protein
MENERTYVLQRRGRWVAGVNVIVVDALSSAHARVAAAKQTGETTQWGDESRSSCERLGAREILVIAGGKRRFP